MGLRIAAGLLVVLGAAWAFQRPFREYPGQEYTGFEVPAGANERTEFVMGRLMFPASPYGMFGGLDRYYDWRTGHTGWTNDYPRADRHFVQAVRRLTRIHVRSTEQPINLDEGGVGDWPWLYAVQTGHWQLTDGQAKAMREYLLRGGFFMADDFWGPDEWDVFMQSMQKVFPDRQVVELENKDAIFHTVY